MQKKYQKIWQGICQKRISERMSVRGRDRYVVSVFGWPCVFFSGIDFVQIIEASSTHDFTLLAGCASRNYCLGANASCVSNTAMYESRVYGLKRLPGQIWSILLCHEAVRRFCAMLALELHPDQFQVGEATWFCHHTKLLVLSTKWDVCWHVCFKSVGHMACQVALGYLRSWLQSFVKRVWRRWLICFAKRCARIFVSCHGGDHSKWSIFLHKNAATYCDSCCTQLEECRKNILHNSVASGTFSVPFPGIRDARQEHAKKVVLK